MFSLYIKLKNSCNALHDRKKIFPDFDFSCNSIYQDGTQEVML